MKTKPDSKYPGMKFVGAWLPDELYKKLKTIAKSDDRSVSVFMRRLIEKAVDAECHTPAAIHPEQVDEWS